MALDTSFRLGFQSASVTAVRPIAEAAQQAVPTQLPESQTVTPIQRPAESRNDPNLERERLTRQIVYDRKAGQYVYQVLDESKENVVVQFPDETRIRALTYFRTMDLLKKEPVREPVADKKA